MDVVHTRALNSAELLRGAVFTVEGGRQVPASFGDRDGELSAAHSRAVVADISHWSHFTLGGKDGPKFVQGLTTNDILGLEVGSGCYTAFLNVHGRIEADCHVFRFETEYLLQTPPEAGDWLAASLGRFVRAGDFKFRDLRESHSALTFQGPVAMALLARALDARLEDLPELGCFEVLRDEVPLRVIRTRRSNASGADVVGEDAEISDLWTALVSASEHSIVPTGVETLEMLRMEAGIPRFGRDFDNSTVLQEVDVPDIVSFKKGCYLGQEIVARVHYLGQPSKLLRKLEIDGDDLPSPGSPILASSDETASAVGVVTSAIRSPFLGSIVFGVVKRKSYADGTPVVIRTDQGDVRATVRERTIGASKAGTQ